MAEHHFPAIIVVEFTARSVLGQELESVKAETRSAEIWHLRLVSDAVKQVDSDSGIDQWMVESSCCQKLAETASFIVANWQLEEAN